MRLEWVNDEIKVIMTQVLETLECNSEDLMGVHSANNWNDCEELKEDLKVMKDEIVFLESDTDNLD